MKIILLIKQIRREENLSLKQLSIRSGVSTTHINDIEKGEKGPSLEIMIKLAKALDTSIELLYKVKW